MDTSKVLASFEWNGDDDRYEKLHLEEKTGEARQQWERFLDTIQNGKDHNEYIQTLAADGRTFGVAARSMDDTQKWLFQRP